jgi:LuxR family transcriptional regulator, maltose regulon positive regulatory protein
VAGDIRGAEVWLRNLAGRTRMDAYLETGHYHFLAALVAQQKGEFAQGLKQAEQALAMTTDAGSPFPQALSHLAISLSLLQLGEDTEAEKHTSVARAIGKEMGNGFIEYLSSLIEARTLIERGEEVRGLEKLAVTLRHGREGGRYAVHWWGPATMARLYAKALDAGIEVEYVQEVIRRTQLTPPDSAAAPDDWPWQIRLYTFGGFSVIKDGQVLRFAGKVQKKPVELLQYLIALGGREVPEGRVADQLWPDAEGDAAYRSLIVTLHRLRQWLGYPDAVELAGGQLSLNPKLVWVDIWAFERLISRAGGAGKSDVDGSAATKKALALYRGSFLESSDRPWVLARREQLRAKFIRCVLARGQALESEARWSDAIACYQCGIDVEPFVELFHRQLIECYRRAGSIAESEVAAAHWERLRALPGVPPARGH